MEAEREKDSGGDDAASDAVSVEGLVAKGESEGERAIEGDGECEIEIGVPTDGAGEPGEFSGVESGDVVAEEVVVRVVGVGGVGVGGREGQLIIDEAEQERIAAVEEIGNEEALVVAE